MKIYTKAVHAGDRKQAPEAIPSTTPIYTGTTYLYPNVETLDKVFGHEVEGQSYARYENPTNNNLEELGAALENGAGALACSSGMAAVEIAIKTALLDRRKSIVAATALYGATINMLTKVFEPFGVETTWVDVCDIDAVREVVMSEKPGCVLMETISNPLLRVGQVDKIADISREAGAALVVDNTFATPMLVRPLELGAHLVAHSVTKYLAGHGDVLGGLVVSDEAHLPVLRQLSRTIGPTLGPFEAYLTMRGIKTFPLRFERQCANACAIAQHFAAHPKVEKVHYTGDPTHPDAATISRLFPKGISGAMVSIALKDASKQDVFAFMDRLKLVVKGTSLGDVHTLVLYPIIASHRDLSPKQRQRLGIGDNLVRFSIGIEAHEDLIADIEQALG